MHSGRRIGGWALVLLAAGSFAGPAQESGKDEMPAKMDLSRLEPERRFDFLLGRWDYATASNGAHGHTEYRQVVEGQAVLELLPSGFFNGREFAGASLFTYDSASGLWSQRWIDTLGNVIQGSGKMESYEGSSLPAMITTFALGEQRFKHVWYDITEDRFETDLHLSTDGGKTFKLVRRMPYTRRR